MNLNEYQQAARETAIYPTDIGLAYTTLGLAGEAGELANKVKKVYRDDAGILTTEARWKLADELGDVLWYVAAVASEIGIKLGNLPNIHHGTPERWIELQMQGLDNATMLLPYATLQLIQSVGELTETVTTGFEIRDKWLSDPAPDYKPIQDHAAYQLASILWLVTIIVHLIGIVFEDIAYINLNKLQARRANNAIKGEGDHR